MRIDTKAGNLDMAALIKDISTLVTAWIAGLAALGFRE
jgi:hypothetical protein